MLLKYFYDRSLAHASYLVGCQQTGDAIVIDPGRSVDQYLTAAASEGLRIAASTETHIHADFVSGSRELADRAGARLYLSNEGTADWKYQFAGQHDSHLVAGGDIIHVGKIRLEVLHTPGHTPESVSFMLTDEGNGATIPMGIFTGDFVFVGSIGRPDLLETAAGVVGSADASARQLFRSVQRFRQLPDHMQVWPAHGAGSACGKGLGAIPSSTVGYEKLLNPALQFKTEDEFVRYILADQPETPPYFAVMKRVNKVGPTLLRDLPPVEPVTITELARLAPQHLVIDTRPSGEFAAGHVPATINIPSGSLVQWAGFFVDAHTPVYLLTEASQLANDLKSLRSIGIDRVAGYFDAVAVRSAGLLTETTRSATPQQLLAQIDRGSATLIDVRAATEYRHERIAQAEHRFLGSLLRDMNKLDKSRPLVTQCLGGSRSAIAASLLQRAGFDVTNMQGGYRAWVAAGFPVISS